MIGDRDRVRCRSAPAARAIASIECLPSLYVVWQWNAAGDVVERDEIGEVVAGVAAHLVGAVADLGRDPRQIERAIHELLVGGLEASSSHAARRGARAQLRDVLGRAGRDDLRPAELLPAARGGARTRMPSARTAATVPRCSPCSTR